jgi:hypothetical protein
LRNDSRDLSAAASGFSAMFMVHLLGCAAP